MDLLVVLMIAIASVGLLVLFRITPDQARATAHGIFPSESPDVEPCNGRPVPVQEVARRLGWASRSGRPHHQAVVVAGANEGLVDDGALHLAPIAEDVHVEHLDGESRVERARYVTAHHPQHAWEWWLGWSFTPEGAERMQAAAGDYAGAVGEAFEVRANGRARRHGIGGRRVVHRVHPRELALHFDPRSVPFDIDECEEVEGAVPSVPHPAPVEEGTRAAELAGRVGWTSTSGRPHHLAVLLAGANAGYCQRGWMKRAYTPRGPEWRFVGSAVEDFRRRAAQEYPVEGTFVVEANDAARRAGFSGRRKVVVAAPDTQQSAATPSATEAG